MKYAAGFFIAAVLCCVPAFAQESFNVEFGAHAGMPLNHTLESAYCCTTGTAFISYQPSDASYLVGVSEAFSSFMSGCMLASVQRTCRCPT